MFGFGNKHRSETKHSTRIRGFGVPLSCAGLIVAVSVWSYARIEQSLKRALTNELTTILHADVTALRLWVDGQETAVGVRANEPRVRELVGELVSLAAQQTTTPDVLLHSTSLRELREYLEPVCRAHGHIGFVVMDRRGVNVGALLDEPVGQRSLVDRSDFVERALAGETLVCRPFPGEVLLPDEKGVFRADRPTMFAAAPVRDEGGQIVATLSFRIRPEVDFTRILSVAQSGESGETLAFDGDGLLLSTSRFDAQLKDIGLLPDRVGIESNLRIQLRDPGGNLLEGFRPSPEEEQPLTEMVAKAVAGHSGVDVDGYRDYRGVPVVGAWTWLPEYGFGVVTQMDRAEAYGPLTQARRAFAVTVGLLFLAATASLLLELKNRKAVDALRNSEARNCAIMESAADGIITIDQHGIIQSFNAAAESMFGHIAGEAIGKSVNMLMPSPYQEEHDAYLECYLHTGEANIIGQSREVEGLRKDGATFPIEIAVSEVLVSKRRLFTGIVHDITERKRARADLEQSNEVRGEQARAMELLFSLSRSLVPAKSIESIIEHVLSATAELTGCRRVSIMLPDKDAEHLVIAAAIGISEELVGRIRVPVGSAIAGQVFASGKSLVLNTPQNEGACGERYDSEFFASAPLVCTTLSIPGKVVGVLNVTERHDRRPFEPHEIEYLDLVSNMTASAIEQLQSGLARENAHSAIVIGLAKLAEHRDSDTGKHLERVTQYALRLARELGKSSRHAASIDDRFLRYLEQSMPLHDIGKVSVPDAIMLKSGRLTDAEFAVMKRHTDVGADSIQSVIDQAPEADFLVMARDIAHCHHEWFDGSGYPRGLRGGEIPIAARIAAVADVYDALTTTRPYKEAFPHEKAVGIIRDSLGSQFDPNVVDIFLRLERGFAELMQELRDESDDSHQKNAVRDLDVCSTA